MNSPKDIPEQELNTASVDEIHSAKSGISKKRTKALILHIKNISKNYSSVQKVIAVLFAVLVICLLAWLGWALTHGPSKDTGINRPQYKPALPKGRSLEELGGLNRVSPPNSEPVFAFTDTINTVPVSVSQQALPKSLANNKAEGMADMAKRFNANNVIQVDDINVYIGTSVKGPQSVLFIKNNLLILIKSKSKIDDSYWEEYIHQLE